MPERLWAPWRFPYIERAKEGGTGCIFVDLPNESDDRKNLIVHRGKTAFVIMNAFPYSNGHLMVAPYRHTANLSDLTPEEMTEIQSLIAKSVEWLTQAFNPEGFNIGLNLGRAAGAGILDHLHWHIVPRWVGDTNFMPVIGEVRVLPQSLEDAYDRLRDVISREAQK